MTTMQIRTDQDIIDLLQATRSLRFVFFNSYPDEDILVDIPIAIATLMTSLMTGQPATLKG